MSHTLLIVKGVFAKYHSISLQITHLKASKFCGCSGFASVWLIWVCVNSVLGAIFHFKANRKQLVPFSVASTIYHIQRALPMLRGFTKHSCLCVDIRSVFIPIITSTTTQLIPCGINALFTEKKKLRCFLLCFCLLSCMHELFSTSCY